MAKNLFVTNKKSLVTVPNWTLYEVLEANTSRCAIREIYFLTNYRLQMYACLTFSINLRMAFAPSIIDKTKILVTIRWLFTRIQLIQITQKSSTSLKCKNIARRRRKICKIDFQNTISLLKMSRKWSILEGNATRIHWKNPQIFSAFGRKFLSSIPPLFLTDLKQGGILVNFFRPKAEKLWGFFYSRGISF